MPAAWPGASGGVAAPVWPLGVSAGLALLAGVVHTAAFAPLEFWWLQPLALAGLVALADGRPARQAGLLGWCFGLGWLSSGLWWLYISMHRYGGLPSVVAALAVVLLAATLALYYAAALVAWARWRGRRPARSVLLLAACWLAAELARASWFTGFPWLASGYAHTTGPLAAWAPWLGIYGISALAAALAAALAGAGLALWPGRPGPAAGWRRPLSVLAAVALPVVVGPWALPQDFTRDAGRLSVSLVQPNVAQDLKFDAGHLQANLDALALLVRSASGTLVVTPESVVPLPYEVVDPDYWRQLHASLAGSGRAALVGVFLADGSGRYVNSMVGLSAQSPPQAGRHYRYGKRHLLPFGEFIPPGFGWFVRAMRIPLDDQAAGVSQAAFAVAGQRLRPLICYEDLFGEDIVASVRGPDAATIFVNASNLAWFGKEMVQDQHLQFSRMRALELQRPVVRATNTGATAVVDHRGRVTHRLPPEVVGRLDAMVQGRLGETPYARWLGDWGLAPLWLLAGVVAGWAAWRSRVEPADS
jgi:apolipoprotein N-acyltransferase